MNENQNTEETVDIRELLSEFKRYWYYFIGAVFLFLFIAFLYNRYTEPVYEASSTILIRDDDNTTLGAENLLEGLELFSGKKNLKNEIGIIHSFDLIRKTLIDLDLGISYYHLGDIRTAEVYSKKPFKVVIDSSHVQTLGIAFQVNVLTENSFELVSEATKVKQYLPTQDAFIENKYISYDFEKEYHFGEIVESDYFRFSLEKTEYSYVFEEEQTEYYFVLHDINNLTEKYRKKFEVAPINKDASILQLKSKGTVPRKEKDFLNKISDNYIAIGLQEKNMMASNTINFINEQLVYIADSLTQAESLLEEFKSKNPNLELSYKEFGTFYQFEKLESEKAMLEVNREYYITLLEYVNENDNADNIIAPSSMGINDPLLNNLINEIVALYSEKKALAINSKEKHPIYKALEVKIKNSKQSLIENINSLIESSNISLSNVNERINKLESSINNLPENERALLNIKRKFDLNESIYTYLLQKRSEAAIAKAGNVADNKVIDIARLTSREPISPQKKIIYLIAIALGLFLPTTYIVLRDFFDNTIKNRKELEKLTPIPIIGGINHSDKSQNLVVLNSPKSIISEGFRSIRTGIQYMSADKEQKIISLTSSISAEGKTFCSMNLASVFALSDSPTLLIGADLRKPKIFNDFMLSNEEGLSSYLINKSSIEEIIQKSNIENLDIILSGPTPPNPSELLDTDKMNQLIETLKNKYKYIIIDTPPVGLVTDGYILMKHADIKLFVVREGYTTKQMLSNINNIYKEKSLSNMSLIFNDVESNGYGYNYGYGYGYGYGYYDEDTKKEKGFFKKLFS